MTKYFCSILIALTISIQAQADSSRASELLGAIQTKEAADGVPERHRSVISLSSEPSCKSILILHGLYESPYYMKGLTKYFVSRGFNVVSILLSGHFRQQDPQMKNFRYTDWRRDAVEGLKVAKQLGSQVFVLGYSTGGTMAADIALQYPNDIAGLFMFAPALDISTRTKLMVQTGVKIKFMPSESCTGDHLSPMCKAVGSLAAGSVKKAMPLLQEGLSWSPYAGVQVSHYIGAIYKDWKDKVQSIDESETEGKSTTLVKIYSLIRQPTFMALDEQDLTVSTYLSKAVFQNLASPKDLIVYSDADAIAHTNITKYSEDAYQGSKEFYNHFTEELESRMDQFITAVNPACK